MRIHPCWLYRLVGDYSLVSLEVDPDGVVIHRVHGDQLVLHSEMKSLSLVARWPWSRLRILGLGGRQDFIDFGGLSRKAILDFIADYRAVREANSERVERMQREPKHALSEFKSLLSLDAYLAKPSLRHWKLKWRKTYDLLGDRDYTGLPDRFQNCFENAERHFAAHNETYVRQQLREHSEWFGRLTERQREAIVRDDDRCLVLAGAGTGKTTTLVNKARFLFRKGHAAPSEVLVLAFAKKARKEIEGRFKNLNEPTPVVSNFHAYGLAILTQCIAKKPTVSKMAKNKGFCHQRLQEFITQSLANNEMEETVREYLSTYLGPYRSEFDFSSLQEYYAHLKHTPYQTLNGEAVKSWGELTIANWLLLNDVQYEYEPKYRFPTATRMHRQYEPDFYLPKHDIYIEYYALNRADDTPPYIDAEEYKRQIEWKREAHKRHGTRLIEFYSHECSKGILQNRLAEELTAAGVPWHPLSNAALLELLKGRKVVTELAGLAEQFLDCFKANGFPLEEIRQRASEHRDRPRMEAFLKLFEFIFERYEAELKAAGEIDFHDMIVRATAAIREGKYRVPFARILVDEFQDISKGRYEFLKAHLDKRPDCRLFCVGDDWQSIYGFTGSDIGYILQFEKHFSACCRTDLDKSFRCNEKILECSSRFVLNNPGQLSKHITSTISCDGLPFVVLAEEKETQSNASGSTEGIRAAVADIERREQGSAVETKVFVLGRYKHNLPSTLHGITQVPTINLQCMTVHASKGLEADYVILTALVAGKHGFPSGIQDDPILQLVRPCREAFPDAEERRLFYVALTRARKGVYLLTDRVLKSPFLEEFEATGCVERLGCDSTIGHPTCPECGGKTLVLRQGKRRTFWGCRYFPYCGGKAEVCETCNSGAMLRKADEYRCSTCPRTDAVCPGCRHGMQVRREGLRGPFLGCTNYPTCRWTQSLSG